MRYFIDLSYQGAAYHGWQIQNNAHTVQAELQNVLSTLLATPTSITGSGRTDTGVHAKRQIAHFDTDSPIDTSQLVKRMNSFLPDSCAIHGIFPVKEDAHARFSATTRLYEYHIHRSKSPFLNDFSTLIKVPFEVDVWRKCLQILLEYTDFEAFSKIKTDVNTFDCTFYEIDIQEVGDRVIIYLKANRFLRGMVRAIVGTSKYVAMGKMSLDEFHSIIQSKDRKKAGESAPPQGLFLSNVEYPSDLYLSEMPVPYTKRPFFRS